MKCMSCKLPLALTFQVQVIKFLYFLLYNLSVTNIFGLVQKCIRVVQRNRTNRMRMYACICICLMVQYYKELAPGITEVGKSKICRVSWQAGDQENQPSSLSPKAVCDRTRRSHCCRWSVSTVCWKILAGCRKAKHVALFRLQLFG